jgi:hypothetical protein
MNPGMWAWCGQYLRRYELADKVLGVDPWWRFTQNTPEYLGQIELATSFESIVPPPVFEYRGIFTNDEDLLGYFRRDPVRDIAPFIPLPR